ncbi:uncharacterized protein CEXT_329091 [Caerostris extrusa]|uniref:Uncharacterized protein n=1 Tax=Caerostris extrusa TaxID=172846 RepID=A0AAV4NU11_CAEEX|nr:uncharacterized protein CEXT_329091 [Caerostris extrusa]
MASNPPGFMKPPHVPFLSSKMSEKGKLFKLQLRRRHTSGIEERPSRSKERLGEFFLFLLGVMLRLNRVLETVKCPSIVEKMMSSVF